MGDFSLDFGGDLTASPSGDFAVADGDVLSRQRVIRRLLTNPLVVLDTGEILDADYLEDPTYGAGLGREIGKSIAAHDADRLQAFLRQAMLPEDSVDQTHPPVLALTLVKSGVRMQMSYISAQSGKRIFLPSMIAS